MKTNKKIIFIVTILIIIMSSFMLINFIYNFKTYSISTISQKANTVAKIVENSLTTQMQTGSINQRELFLKQLEELPNINKIWLSRSSKLISMYGKGFNNEIAKDEIDKEVLKTGKTIESINDNLFSDNTYRVTIPYKAISNKQINCITCHSTSKLGDTLGAISIEIPINDAKEATFNIVMKTTIFSLISIILIAILINHFISPFLKLFDAIKQVMEKAQKGDYTYRISPIKNQEAKLVSNWINTLLDKLEDTLTNIDTKISVFLSNKQKYENDVLINVKNTVDRLSEVYKFRKTIELDDNLDDVYKRLAQMINGNLYINDFNIFEADTRTGAFKPVYITNKLHCDIEKFCRADQTNTIVDSSQFKNICTSCKINKTYYLCIPYSISNDLDLIISIYANTKEEIENIRDYAPYIDDYIDASKSIIISNKLMDILVKNAKTDALTGLYNRKFLDDELDKLISQAQRTKTTYGVLMLDIDHFKMVNDTYGHDIGDVTIKILSQTLQETIRKSDIAIRYGGEEFIVLLHNCKKENLFDVAQNIRKSFEAKSIPAGNTTINKTISIGATTFPFDDNNILECIKNADLALYKAKNTGRNKVVIYTKDLEE